GRCTSADGRCVRLGPSGHDDPLRRGERGQQRGDNRDTRDREGRGRGGRRVQPGHRRRARSERLGAAGEPRPHHGRSDQTDDRHAFRRRLRDVGRRPPEPSARLRRALGRDELLDSRGGRGGGHHPPVLRGRLVPLGRPHREQLDEPERRAHPRDPHRVRTAGHRQRDGRPVGDGYLAEQRTGIRARPPVEGPSDCGGGRRLPDAGRRRHRRPTHRRRLHVHLPRERLGPREVRPDLERLPRDDRRDESARERSGPRGDGPRRDGLSGEPLRAVRTGAVVARRDLRHDERRGGRDPEERGGRRMDGARDRIERPHRPAAIRPRRDGEPRRVVRPKILASGPTIHDVTVTGIGSTTATVRWTTVEPATTEVRYGTIAGSLTSGANTSDLRMDHTITLTNLRPQSRYYLEVTSRGRLANATTDTDGGADYQFDTSAIGDVLVVVGGSSFPPEREASYAAALASNGWTGSFWRVAELGLPPLAVLQARRAVIWQVGLEQYPPFNASARPLVQSYLDGGGRLVVSSHDTAWALGNILGPAPSPFATAETAAWVRGVLKATFTCDPTTIVQVRGLTSDPISGAYTGGVAYTPHRDGGADDELTTNPAGGSSSVMWTDGSPVTGCTPSNQPIG